MNLMFLLILKESLSMMVDFTELPEKQRKLNYFLTSNIKSWPHYSPPL